MELAEARMEIQVASATGEGPTDLAAFDRALFATGIANYNLVVLSSVIPEGASVVEVEPAKPQGDWGDCLAVVLAQERAIAHGTQAWAGLGWTQDRSGAGLFVEHHGASEAEVVEQIHETLESMRGYRDRCFDEPRLITAGITCFQDPVCAVAVAVFGAWGWSALDPAD